MGERSEKLSQMQGRLYEAFLREVTQSRLRAEAGKYKHERERVFASVGNFTEAYAEMTSRRKPDSHSINYLTKRTMRSFRHTADWEKTQNMSVLDFLLERGYLDAARRLVLGCFEGDRHNRWKYMLRIFAISKDPKDLERARKQLATSRGSIRDGGANRLIRGIMSIAQASGSKEDLDWGERVYQNLKKVVDTTGHADYWQRRASITDNKGDAKKARQFARKLAKEEAKKKEKQAREEEKRRKSLGYLIQTALEDEDVDLLLEAGERLLELSSAEREDYFSLMVDMMEAINEIGLDPYKDGFKTF